MKRYRDLEKLQATTRAELPRVAMLWLAAVRGPLEALTTAAMNPELTDAEFIKLVADFSEGLPELLKTIDHSALAELMENSMGAAMGNGIAVRTQNQESRDKTEVDD